MNRCALDLCRQGREVCTRAECWGSPLITSNSDGSASDEAADRPLSTPSDFAAKVLVFAVCLAALLAAAASVVVR